METRKIGIIIAISVLLLTVVSACVMFGDHSSKINELMTELPDIHIPTVDKPDTDVAAYTSAFDVANAMGVGWNLGNALDSIDNEKKGILSELKDTTPEEYYETYWGNPVTTAEMIDTIANTGFGAIRVPVTYADHMDKNLQISPDWLERVEQVVNYVLDNDMYCIINLHHDSGTGSWPWLKADPDSVEQLEEQLRTVWLQIAEHFKEYDDTLLFEGFNEILDESDHWSGADSAAYNTVNRLNQVFIDTVRDTGGNNAQRFLIVKTYAAGTNADILDAFVVPDDSVTDRLIVGVHYYGVMPFIWQQELAGWTGTYSDWDYLRDGIPVETSMERLNKRFIEKGIPVIICEFGAHNKANTVDRVNYVTHYVETAKQYGIACLWWDDGGFYENADSIKNYVIFDRNQNRWFFPQIADAMIAAAK